MARSPDKLTDIQSRFIDEYMIDRNGAQAAKRAGYSDKQAKVQGYLLLKMPKIRNEVDRRIGKQAEKAQITAESVLAEIQKLAFAEISKDIRASDKTKNLELLGKWLKLFTDKQELSGPDGGALVVEVRKYE